LRSTSSFLRWFSISALLATATLVLFELVSYSRARTQIPRGVNIAGLSVGGMTVQEASQTLMRAFNQPIETHYGDNIFYISPSQVGFSLDTASMLAAVDAYRITLPFWNGFWDFLWNSRAQEYSIPIKAEYSRTQLQALLKDIAARYDLPPVPPQPEPGRPFFTAGKPGTVLNQDRGAELLAQALFSPTHRVVDLPVLTNQYSLPSQASLETLIKQVAIVDNYYGLLDVYMANLQTGQEMHIISYNGQDYPLEPDIAFAAISTIKIPILLSTFINLDGSLDPVTEKLLNNMLGPDSDNPSADQLMQKLDPKMGPLIVTQNLFDLGYKNTFIAGYYQPGSVLLKTFSTPANQREDIQTELDPYNQTTPVEMGMILQDIYQCSQGGGTLLLLLPGKITVDNCNMMIDLLSQDNLGVFIQGGVPEGTRVAHKHGWVYDPFHTFADAAIVYSPGGNYVLSIFFWQSGWLDYNVGSRTISDISKAVYSYFNPPNS
jgi:Beta-lactamase enzyme family